MIHVKLDLLLGCRLAVASQERDLIAPFAILSQEWHRHQSIGYAFVCAYIEAVRFAPLLRIFGGCVHHLTRELHCYCFEVWGYLEGHSKVFVVIEGQILESLCDWHVVNKADSREDNLHLLEEVQVCHPTVDS